VCAHKAGVQTEGTAVEAEGELNEQRILATCFRCRVSCVGWTLHSCVGNCRGNGHWALSWLSRARWCTLVIIALGMLRSKDREFKVSLGYVVRPCLGENSVYGRRPGKHHRLPTYGGGVGAGLW
jgi:hypothetical protein